MLVELYLPQGGNYEEAREAVERFSGLHLRAGTDMRIVMKSPKNFEYGILLQCPAEIFGEVMIEIEAEGWLDV